MSIFVQIFVQIVFSLFHLHRSKIFNCSIFTLLVILPLLFVASLFPFFINFFYVNDALIIVSLYDCYPSSILIFRLNFSHHLFLLLKHLYFRVSFFFDHFSFFITYIHLHHHVTKIRFLNLSVIENWKLISDIYRPSISDSFPFINFRDLTEY